MQNTISRYSFVADHLDNTVDGVPANELWSEALFFFPAGMFRSLDCRVLLIKVQFLIIFHRTTGGDTTTTAISALSFYLSRNRDVYQKLAAEIRTRFTDHEDIRGGQKLASCRYLRACIDEALRISPPVTGHVIPPSTQVGVNIYSLHHNETYFERQFNFDPDRWLVEDAATLTRMHSAFCPFSLGGRGCAGKSMAYLEANLVLAKTIWLFDFELAPGKMGEAGEGGKGKGRQRERPSEFQLYDTFGSRHDGPNLLFHRRVSLPSTAIMKTGLPSL